MNRVPSGVHLNLGSEDPPFHERLDDETRGMIDTETQRLRAEGWDVSFRLGAGFLTIKVDHDISCPTSHGVDLERATSRIKEQLKQYFLTNSEFNIVRSGLGIVHHSDLVGALRRTHKLHSIPSERLVPAIESMTENDVISLEEATWVRAHLRIRAYGEQ